MKNNEQVAHLHNTGMWAVDKEYVTVDKFEKIEKEVCNKLLKNEMKHQELELKNNNEHIVLRFKQHHTKIRIDNLYDMVMGQKKKIESMRKIIVIGFSMILVVISLIILKISGMF